MNKEKLEEYLSQGLTNQEIAAKENIKLRYVSDSLRKYSLASNKKYKDQDKYIGQKFNYLTIKSFYLPKHTDVTVAGFRCICKCDCGTTVEDLPVKIITGKRKTCGESTCTYFKQVRVDASKKSSQGSFTGHEEIYGSRWASWRIGAKKRNLAFEISIEYAWDLYISQNKLCALSGIPISFDGKWNSSETTASLDRIDSSKGYVEGNIQWVHKRINLMKGDLSDEDFTEWCRKVWVYRNSINT